MVYTKQDGAGTQPVRLPRSRTEDSKLILANDRYKFPLYASRVSAGFPSPADDCVESKLDLNTHLIQHPAATFFVRAVGDCMKEAGIHSGDMLIVDRSLEARHGNIIIAILDGELKVKRLSRLPHRMQLLSTNPQVQPIDITDELVIWGVVTHVIHALS